MSARDLQIAKTIVEQTRRSAGLEGEDEIIIWHVVRALLEYSDHIGLDFDLLLEDVRADFKVHP